MRNVHISTRLALGFGFFIAIILVMAGISMWRTKQTQQDNISIQQRNLVNVAILQWGRNVEVNGERTIALTHIADPKVEATFAENMKATSAHITELQNKVESLIEAPEAKALFQKVLDARKRYTSARAQAIKDDHDGKTEQATHFFIQEMPGLIASYKKSIDSLYAFQAGHEERLFKEDDARSQQTLLILGVLAALSILVGFLLAWAIRRSIARPLKQTVFLAGRVANRDLSHDIEPQGHDEITELEHALHKMMTGLSGAVGEVRTGADSIASAAAQITAGNLDLSSRTEQQASSLAQTAATMEQITATVRQNADSVQQANTLASAAAKTATDGGTIVAQLVTTMGEINQKSKQVADIIGVIDSIAFQTNILALNAAVEAARAGEQGRGFAVVASEVRALAQRSASAAKEIKTLIDASVQSTSQGNEQASHAGATMQDIVNDINRVTDIMGEISAANREQTTGIEEINTAVTQMDDVTRQNASLVEESAAAASSLQDQANTLAQLVESFRLNSAQVSSRAEEAAVEPLTLSIAEHASRLPAPATRPSRLAARAGG